MTTAATMIVFQSFPSHVSALPSSSTTKSYVYLTKNLGPWTVRDPAHMLSRKRKIRRILRVPSVGREDTDLRLVGSEVEADDEDEDEEQTNPSPEDLEYVSQIKRVLELLRKNRDMLFGEVKLIIMIEDPLEFERRKLLGLAEDEGPSRDELAHTLELVNEGKIPKDRIALRLLAEEMMQWPNLEMEPKKKSRGRSRYEESTDIGVDPKEAAKRLNIDWDTAAEIPDDVDEVPDVPAAVGFGALYLVSALPIIIGVSVVLILFYNSLQ